MPKMAKPGSDKGFTLALGWSQEDDNRDTVVRDAEKLMNDWGKHFTVEGSYHY